MTTSSQIKRLLRDRVKRGARWLDSQRPSWSKDVSLERLNIGTSCDCVISQLLDRSYQAVVYYGTPKEIEYGIRKYAMSPQECIERGFDLKRFFCKDDPSFNSKRQVEYLTELWKKEIRVRRGQEVKAIV